MFTLERDEIKSRIMKRDLSICVFGLGRIGLPIACAFADAGFNVIGVDTNPEVVQSVNKGLTSLKEPGLQEKLAKAAQNGKLTATSNGEVAVEKSIFITSIVPLALDEEKEPDFTAINHVAQTISGKLRKGHVVGYETTLPIGTTENLIKPILESSGLKAGEDFGLFYSPERVMSGYVFARLKDLRKIVGGIDEKSAFIASEVYKTISPSGTDVVSNPKTAEMVKLAAGIWRDVNIAFANEMAKIADKFKIDIMEVIEEVNSSPRRLMLQPGCGVGGHCIPVYPYFIIKSLEDASETALTISAARKTNENMPKYTVELAMKQLKKMNKEFEDSHIVILGLAYRPYVRDVAHSPTFEMVEILKAKGAHVSVYDPAFRKNETEELTKVKSGDFRELVESADCIIISTMYDIFENLREVAKPGCVIIDGRNRLSIADKGIGR